MFFAVIVLVVAWLRPNDGQLYQTFVSLLSGFGGAILLHLKSEKVPPAGSTTVTQVEQVTKVPPDKEAPK